MNALFLHSWGSSHHDWDLVAPTFPEGTFVDMRGFGDTPVSSEALDVAAYADDVQGLVAGWTGYSIVGHSMGGKVALAFAARRPPGLRRLILVAPSPPSPEPMTDEDRQANLDGYSSRDFAERTVAKITRAPIPEPYRTQAVDDYVRTSERAWRAWLEGGSKEDLSGLLERVEIPVRVVVGADDPVMRPDMLRRQLVTRLWDATLEEIPGAGHLLPLEKPEELGAALRRWL